MTVKSNGPEDIRELLHLNRKGAILCIWSATGRMRRGGDPPTVQDESSTAMSLYSSPSSIGSLAVLTLTCAPSN